MFFIASTRFNNSTWNENINYRTKYSINGAIYGVPIKIYEKYPLNAIVFVVEMNNDTNQICGISVIRNSLLLDKENVASFCDDVWVIYLILGCPFILFCIIFSTLLCGFKYSLV
jgi:hypothetical protein